MRTNKWSLGLLPWLMQNKAVVAGFLALLFGGGGAVVLLSGSDEEGSLLSSLTGSKEQFSIEETQSRETAKSAVVLGIQLPGYEKISLKSGTLTQNVNFPNAESNSVYFRLSLVLNDTNEVIYKSNLVEPGNTLYEITLERTLTSGNYAATVHYETFTMDGEFTPQNGASMETVLSVS